MSESKEFLEKSIRERVQALYTKGGWRDVFGAEFVMEPADAVVIQELDIMTDQGRFRLAATKPEARPPFEWLFEITSEINTGTAMRHYLLLENEIVTAERRTLTPLETEDAELILSDLSLVESTIAG